MSIWGRIFAAGYDHFMAGTARATLRPHREAADLAGHVLEIGGGTGPTSPWIAFGPLPM
jgi:hypothetical protein